MPIQKSLSFTYSVHDFFETIISQDFYKLIRLHYSTEQLKPVQFLTRFNNPVFRRIIQHGTARNCPIDDVKFG
jgi:hypothetical protein